MEMKVIEKWGESHGGDCYQAKSAVWYGMFLLENYLVSIQCYHTVLHFALYCTLMLSPHPLLFFQHPQPDCCSAAAMSYITAMICLLQGTLLCSFFPAHLRVYTLYLPFCWHRWEKEKPISACFLNIQGYPILSPSGYKKSVNQILNINFFKKIIYLSFLRK